MVLEFKQIKMILLNINHFLIGILRGFIWVLVTHDTWGWMVLVKDCFQSDVRGVFGWRYCIFSRWRFQIFLFSPLFGKISNLSSIFFRWVVQPPTSFFAYILRFGKKCIFLSYDPTGNPYAVESSNKFSFITFDWPWLRDFFVLLNIGWSWFLNFDPPSKNLRSTLFLIQRTQTYIWSRLNRGLKDFHFLIYIFLP